MKQYEYEDRALIYGFLQDLIKEKSTLHHNQNFVYIPLDVINELCEQFKKITYGDIKNEIGTKFKRKGHSEELVIVYNDNNDSIAIVNISKGLMFPLCTLNDDIEVEIL